MDYLHIAEGLVLNPGDKVLITFEHHPTMEHAQEFKSKLEECFPGIEFTLVSGVGAMKVVS